MAELTHSVFRAPRVQPRAAYFFFARFPARLPALRLPTFFAALAFAGAAFPNPGRYLVPRFCP